MPSFHEDIGAWASAGFAVRLALASDQLGLTVGIPTFQVPTEATRVS